MKRKVKEQTKKLVRTVAGIKQIVSQQKEISLRERINIFLGAVAYYPKAVLFRFMKDDGLFLASGIGFAVVTCIIPLILLVASVLGMMLESPTTAIQSIQEMFGNRLLPIPYLATVRETLVSVIEEIINNRTGFGFVAAFTLIWTSTNLFAFTRSSLHRIYRVTQTRNIFMSILEDIFWVLVLAVLFFVVNFIVWMSSLLQQIIYLLPNAIQTKAEWIEYSFPALLIFIVFTMMFYVIYYRVPDQHVPKKVALISALTTAILWQGAGWFFSWYVVRFPTFGKIYGTYAFLIVSLLWIYYSGITFVIGGEVGQLYREKHNLKFEGETE
jgi:membrane protein